MRVRNNAIFNVSVPAKHTGNGTPAYVNIPAGSTLELDDELWADYEKGAEPMLDNGILEITKAVPLSAEAEEARNSEALAAAEKLVANHKAAVAKKAAADKATKAAADK